MECSVNVLQTFSLNSVLLNVLLLSAIFVNIVQPRNVLQSVKSVLSFRVVKTLPMYGRTLQQHLSKAKAKRYNFGPRTQSWIGATTFIRTALKRTLKCFYRLGDSSGFVLIIPFWQSVLPSVTMISKKKNISKKCQSDEWHS